MEVVTKSFSISSREYFKIIMGNFLKRRWWFLLFMWLMALINLFGDYEGGNFFIFFAVFYSIFIVVRLWTYTHSTHGRSLDIPTQYTFNEEEVYAENEEGTEIKIKYHTFLKAVTGKQYCLLYTAPGNMMIIPMDAFQSDSDRMWFLQHAVGKINNK